MRRGEVLGLRRQDIDFDVRVIRVRPQIQRIQGQLHIGPVKPRAGNRDLPLIGLAKAALAVRRERQESDRANLGRCWTDTGLVFTTRTGRPIEPRNLVRASDQRNLPPFASITEFPQLSSLGVSSLTSAD